MATTRYRHLWRPVRERGLERLIEAVLNRAAREDLLPLQDAAFIAAPASILSLSRPVAAREARPSTRGTTGSSFERLPAAARLTATDGNTVRTGIDQAR